MPSEGSIRIVTNENDPLDRIFAAVTKQLNYLSQVEAFCDRLNDSQVCLQTWKTIVAGGCFPKQGYEKRLAHFTQLLKGAFALMFLAGRWEREEELRWTDIDDTQPPALPEASQ
jgi:hypothetical protein